MGFDIILIGINAKKEKVIRISYVYIIQYEFDSNYPILGFYEFDSSTPLF